MAPEGASDCANEWLPLVLYDASVFAGWRRPTSTHFSLGLNTQTIGGRCCCWNIFFGGKTKESAGKKQAETARELSMVRLEKQEVETMMSLDLQAAKEIIAALDKEIPRLEKLDSERRRLRAEKLIWEQERAELIEWGKEAEIL